MILAIACYCLFNDNRNDDSLDFVPIHTRCPNSPPSTVPNFCNLTFRKGDLNNNDLESFPDEQELIKKEDKEDINKQACGTLVETTALLGDGFVDETLYADAISAEELARNLTSIKKEVELANVET